MITVLLCGPLEPPTEGASSRLHAIVSHLKTRDAGIELLAASRTRRGRPMRLASVARAAGLAARALRAPGRLILISAPHVPFFDSPSRLDLAAASVLLSTLRAGARRAGKAVVPNLHDVRSLQLPDFAVGASRRAIELFRSLERRTFAASDYVLSPGGHWPELLVDRFGVPREKLIDFPNGSVAPRPGAPPPVALPEGVRIAYAGTLSPPARGVEQMVREFTRVRRTDLSLLLLGPGGDWVAPYAATDRRIHWLGALPVEDCIAVLQRCHLGLYPYPDTFYFGLTHTTSKMALYMTCALPVLARRSRSVSEFLAAEDVGESCEMERLAERIEAACCDAASLGRWRENAERIAHRFHWDGIIDRAFEEIAYREGFTLGWKLGEGAR
jgi:glycosyltransferase involved in cell wall biosynthesis